MEIQIIRRFTILPIVFFVLQSFELHAGEISRTYTWVYDKKIYRIDHAYTQPTYDYYKNLRRTYSNFLTYLDESSYFPVIESFSEEFEQLAAKNHFSDWQTVECIVSFIQSFQYVSDGTYEYPKFPVETLVEQGGDCEDTAILLEAILRQMGFDCVLISPEKHMGVGIALEDEIAASSFPKNNQNYYYIETTSMGWCIGDYPDHLSADAIIYDPGQLANARELSADRYSFTDTYAAKDLTEPNPITTTNTSNTSYEYTPNKNTISTNTIDVDEMIIDGEKQTVITKQVNGNEKIIATEGD